MLSAADFQVSGTGLRAGNTATPTGNTCQWIDTGNTCHLLVTPIVLVALLHLLCSRFTHHA